MPCHKPLFAYASSLREGKRAKFIKGSFTPEIIEQRVRERHFVPLPCRQCLGCRIDNSREFGVRSYHEAQMFEHNCFLTLTYDPKKLKSRSLIRKDFQDFAKRLRKHFIGFQTVFHNYKISKPIRIMYCGEYGDKLGRPHFHALLYNFDFLDKKHFFTNKHKNKVFVSDSLNDLWGHGLCSIGEVNFFTSSYVARYICKKINGEKAKDHYQGRVPEFVQHPSQYGLGLKWLEHYKGDVYPHDFVHVNVNKGSSFEMKVPRYYDNWLKKFCPEEYKVVKDKRLNDIAERSSKFSFETLDAKEKIGHKRIKSLVRTLDELQK